MRTVIAIVLVAVLGADEEVRLQLDPRLVITPLPEVRLEEPAVIAVPAPAVDLPLPDLDLSEALGFDKSAACVERIEAGSTESVWTPPEGVGVVVRPVAEIREAAEVEAGGPTFGPILAYQREGAEEAYRGGGGLRTEEGLVPEGFLGFTLPPLARERATITFRIERCEPDPFSDFAARVRRPRR